MFQKYYRLTKPGIIRGNLWNTTGGFLLASVHHIDAWLMTATLCGTALVIACGCVFNNYIDRGIDAKMSRTSKRALVTGEISNRNAIFFGLTLGMIGFGVLLAYTNLLTVAIGSLALFLYVIIYGFFKRRTTFGTLVGSVPGALPPVAGYVAVRSQLDIAAVLIFLILVCWQMAHFYSIALFRQDEYKSAGLPVMPVVHGSTRTKLSILLYIVAFMIACALLTVHGTTGYVYIIVMTVISIVWLLIGVFGYHRLDSVKWGRSMFVFSLTVILTLAIMMSIGGRLV